VAVVKFSFDDLKEDTLAYLADNPMGGSLHIVLEDCNVEDEDVAWCIEYARSRWDVDGWYLAVKLFHASKRTRLRLASLPRP